MKTLVICPVCKTDQHVYAGKICKHTSEGGLTCSGSKTPVKDLRPNILPPTNIHKH